MIPQEEYMETIARRNYPKFLEQGYATAGHNGPHGHLDTPVRNTAHYLIIYSYLYKKYREEKFSVICNVFFKYLSEQQKKSKSGAIQCMITDKFDKLNGLIGQGWVIEALIYYYETFGNADALDVARSIFYSQKYDWSKHLWHRIELDGSDIGIDITSNHNVWFAGCSYKLAEYCGDPKIDETISDFLIKGEDVILNVYKTGLLVHTVECDDPMLNKGKWKEVIRTLCFPLKCVAPRKFDAKYINYGYHIFDIYGFTILKEKYGDFPIFNNEKYKKSLYYLQDITTLLKRNKVYSSRSNVFFFPYNNPAFEWPYVAYKNGIFDENVLHQLWDIQMKLMYNPETDDMSRMNPDIETWNARTYEIIRFLEQ